MPHPTSGALSPGGRGFFRGAQVFVDESKSSGYFVAASVVAGTDVAVVRKAVRAFCRPGQKRIHFKNESPQVRDRFLAEVVRLPVSAVVYVSKGPDRVARPRCLEALVADLAEAGAGRLVLEQDDSVVAADRRTIAAALRSGKHPAASFQYLHCRAYEDPMLWVSDAVAWCFQKGRPWTDRIAPIVAAVHNLDG